MASLLPTRLIRYTLCSLLAVTCLAAVWLAPRLERNRLLRAQCYVEQLDLVELEGRNEQRRQLLEKLARHPELAGQLITEQAAGSDEIIRVPAGLAIQPDALLSIEDFDNNSRTAAAFAPSGWLAETAHWLANAPQRRTQLLYLAGAIFIVGLIPWDWRVYLVWRRRIRRRCMKALSRYIIHTEHYSLRGPHWRRQSEGEPEEEENQVEQR